MSISISNITLSSDFNTLSINTNKTTTMLKDLKLDGKYISRIYWCDPILFSDKKDYCGLIYRRYDTISVILSGHIYDILTNLALNNAKISLTRLNTRIDDTISAISFPKGYALNADIIDDGYYLILNLQGNNYFKVNIQRKKYATYIDNNFKILGIDTLQSFYINPIDNSISRIFLYWNALPSDLDLYVITPDGNRLSRDNDKNYFGYVTATENNQFGPEIISLNTYVNFNTPLKVGGLFDIYSKWISDNGDAMSSTIKIFTEQFGVKNIKNNPETDTICRTNQYWNPGKLIVKSGIDSINLSSNDLITYTVPLNILILYKLGTLINYFNPGDSSAGSRFYKGLIENILDYNQIILYLNSIFYLLKDYPFKVKLVSNNGEISSFTSYVSDNFDNSSLYNELNSYQAYINFTGFNIESSPISAYFYLNESLKQKDLYFAFDLISNATTSGIINVKNLFYNKSIPIVILDENNELLKNFEYRYVNKSSLSRQKYIINKRINRNEYFLIKDKLKTCKIKFTLGFEKLILLSSLISINDTEIPSSFNRIIPYVYHNLNLLNGFKTITNSNKISLYGNLLHYNQYYFNKLWLSNYNRTSKQEEDRGNNNSEMYRPNKLTDFYSIDNYQSNYGNSDFFTRIKGRVSFILNKDLYKIHLLNYNNYIVDFYLPLSALHIEYITDNINSLKATANNKYFYYLDLSINDSYILDSIISQTQGQLTFSYKWNPNGVNVSFYNKSPSGEPCQLIFKRIYTYINRSDLFGMYLPKAYIRNKSNLSQTINYMTNFLLNNLVIDFYEETSGMIEGFDCAFIDFNRMYKLNTLIIDNYTATLDIQYEINKILQIKQYIGIKVLVWLQQNDNSWEIIRSYETVTTDGVNLSYPLLISGKKYKSEIYAIYKRYYGNLSGIYNSDCSDYSNDSQNYQQYKNRNYIEKIIKLDTTELALTGNYGLISTSYNLPYSQFYGKIYTSDGIDFYNDLNGTAILKNQELNIEYNCAWIDNKIYSIDYIYPGLYYFEVKYGNMIIYSLNINFSINNNIETTSKLFYSNITFKVIKYNIYNLQTSAIALYYPSPDPDMTYFWSDLMYYKNFDYLLNIYAKNDLTLPFNNTNQNLIRSYKHITYNDVVVTEQAYSKNNFLFELSAGIYLYSPITKLTNSSGLINANINNNTALINIADLTVISNDTIKIWTPYWYWNYFKFSLDTYNRFGYSFFIIGLSANLYDLNNNLLKFDSENYQGYSYYYYSYNTIYDMNKLCYWAPLWSYQDNNMGGWGILLLCYFSINNEEKYLKTGKYTIKYTKLFKNPANTPIYLCEKDVYIYDNHYFYNNVPEDFPHKQITIRPVFKQSNALSGNFNDQLFKILNSPEKIIVSGLLDQTLEELNFTATFTDFNGTYLLLNETRDNMPIIYKKLNKNQYLILVYDTYPTQLTMLLDESQREYYNVYKWGFVNRIPDIGTAIDNFDLSLSNTSNLPEGTNSWSSDIYMLTNNQSITITKIDNPQISSYINYNTITISSLLKPLNNNTDLTYGLIYYEKSNNDILSGYISYNSTLLLHGIITHQLKINNQNYLLSGNISGFIKFDENYNKNYNVIYNISSIISGIINEKEINYILSGSPSGILVSGYNINLTDNTLLCIPIFGGNSLNIIDYELNTYFGISHSITQYPTWINRDEYEIYCYLDITDSINILDQINYWIDAFDVYHTGDSSNQLDIIGLYSLSSIYSDYNFIDEYSLNNTSMGNLSDCNLYTGIHIEGNKFDYRKEYVLVLEPNNKISIGGYIRDINNLQWDNLRFDINIYKLNENIPFIQLSNLNGNRFDVGTIKKGKYRIEMFLAGTNIDVLYLEDKIKDWQETSTQSILFRTYFAKTSITLNSHYHTPHNTELNVPRSQIAILLELTNNSPISNNMVKNQNNQFTRYYDYYTKNEDYTWNPGLLATGIYNIKFKWNINNITLNKSDLNFTSNNTFTISQSKLHLFVPNTYKQSVGSLFLGTLLDSNNKVIHYKSIIINDNLSCQILSNDIILPNSFDTSICEQEYIYYNVVISAGNSNSLTHVFDHAWGRRIYIIFYNIKTDINNKLTCKALDNSFTFETTLYYLDNSDYWIKIGTLIQASFYHDNLKLGEIPNIIFYDSATNSMNINYPISQVTTNFIDKITNGPLSMLYNWDYSYGRYMRSYHNTCNTGLTSTQIINDNINLYNYILGLYSTPVITLNLYANLDYLIYYRIGNECLLSAVINVHNLPTNGAEYTIIMPYGSIYCDISFINRNDNNTNILWYGEDYSGYATLYLYRDLDDGYDITYKFACYNETVYIRTGHYTISLVLHMQDQEITIAYERLNLLTSNFNLINYININPATIVCRIFNNNGIEYLNCDLKIKIWHNNLIYSVSEFISAEGKISLSLFNIPFDIAVVDSSLQTIIPINSVSTENLKGTVYSILNNKIHFETTNKSEIFYITLQ